ncbi:3'-5' exonuclease [Tissierella praeacuta]|uniref:3'-5' exonuclease n=1 Tax=Tissierella praeacuta TaxID=43131 RepID=UPI0028A7704A|nr:3'-5' exonuclease [Tissierella praeacuta]
MNFNFEEFTEKRGKELNKKMEKNLYNDVFRASIEFDSVQLEVLNSDVDNLLVYGPAGTGKTILAMAKIKELEYSNKSYIMIIYTKSLKAYIEGKMISAGFDNTKGKIYYENEIDDLNNEELELNCDYIIIDEVQDFSYDKIESLNRIANKGIFVYGDDKQNLYPMKTSYKSTINDIINSKLIDNFYVLQSIYRFSKKIYDFAICINLHGEEINFIRPKSHLQESDTPKILEFKTLNDELKYIKTLIENNGWRNVGILVRTNEYVKLIKEWFYNNTDPNSPYFRDIEAKTNNTFDLDFSNEGIKIITYHSSKGLEFDRVFIPICNIYETPDIDGNTDYNYKEALYVAFTRAKYTLIVSYNLEKKHELGCYKSPYLDEIDKNTYKSS